MLSSQFVFIYEIVRENKMRMYKLYDEYAS